MTYKQCKHENVYTDRDRLGNEFEWCPDCEQQIDDDKVGALRSAKPIGTKKEYETALRNILRIGEQHTDSATGRRISDFRAALQIAHDALWGPVNPTEGGLVNLVSVQPDQEPE